MVPILIGIADEPELNLRIAAVMGWNEETTAANLEALEMERAAYLRKPRTGMRLATAAD